MIALSLEIYNLSASLLATFKVGDLETSLVFRGIAALAYQQEAEALSNLLSNFLGISILIEEEANDLGLGEVQDEYGLLGTNCADFVNDEDEHIFICFEEMDGAVEMDYAYLENVSLGEFTNDLKNRILFIANEIGISCTFG